MKFLSVPCKAAVAAATASLLVTRARAGNETQPERFSLSREILAISYEAARLSNISYHLENELIHYGDIWEIKNSQAYITNFTHPDFSNYDYLKFFTQEPDQALVAKLGNMCYVSFRGTNVNIEDWLQNLDPSDRDIHRDNNETAESCEARHGFVDFVDSEAMQYGLKDVSDCMDSISDSCDSATSPCLVITGHSQGGASAAIASVLLHWMKPTVITFGQPPTLDGGCDLVPSERYYRYINSLKEEGEDDDVAFDPVVFSPNFISQSKHYGHAILLGEDTKAVKYLGLDEDATFQPKFFDRQNEIAAHLMGKGEKTDYDARIGALLENYPITTDGFSDGAFCDRDYPKLCATGFCSSNNTCAMKTSGANMISVCVSVASVVFSAFLVLW